MSSDISGEPLHVEASPGPGPALRVWRQRRRIGKIPLPSSMWVAIPWPHDCPVHLLPERWWDRLAKWTGFAREHQTGDQKFDDLVYVATDDVLGASIVVDHPDERTAILSLLGLGAHEIGTFGDELCVRFSNRFGFDDEGATEDQFERDWLAKVAKALTVIASHPPEGPLELRRSRMAAALELGVGTLLSFAGLATIAEIAADRGTIETPALLAMQNNYALAGAAVGLMLVLGVGARAMGRANAHRLSFATFVVVVPSFVALGYFAPPAANTLLDESAGEVVILPVVDRRISKDDDGDEDHLVEVKHPDFATPLQFWVTPEVYAALPPGESCAAVTMREGALLLKRANDPVPAPCPPKGFVAGPDANQGR